MLKIKDTRLFIKCIADAVSEAHLNSPSNDLRNRRINAIAKASAELLEGDTDFIHFEPDKRILYFWSHTSGEIYETGEVCICPAARRDQPCYHRAMRELLVKYFGFLQNPGEIPQVDFADAVFFDAELSIREKLDLLMMSLNEGQTELKPRIEALEKFLKL